MSDDGLTFTSEIKVEPVQQAGGDHMVAAAARVSTSGQDALKYADPEQAGAVKGVIDFLMAHRHGTPFEHAQLTFFVHAPIFVWREWHRHRVGFSYNEESGRYKELSPVFYVPLPQRPLVPVQGYKPTRPQFEAADPDTYAWLVEDLKEGYRDAYRRYKARLERGLAKEVSRIGLPVGIYSSCWVSMNPRSLMHFLSLRTHEPAATFVSYPQWEIEVAARAVEDVFAKGWPVTYEAFCRRGRVAP